MIYGITLIIFLLIWKNKTALHYWPFWGEYTGLGYIIRTPLMRKVHTCVCVCWWWWWWWDITYYLTFSTSMEFCTYVAGAMGEKPVYVIVYIYIYIYIYENFVSVLFYGDELELVSSTFKWRYVKLNMLIKIIVTYVSLSQENHVAIEFERGNCMSSENKRGLDPNIPLVIEDCKVGWIHTSIG